MLPPLLTEWEVNGQRYDAETIHQTSLASLNDEFAEVVDTEELLQSV